MRNPFKSKLAVGILCVVLAAVIAFVGIPALNHTKTATRIAVRVRVDVPQGTKLTAEMLTAAEVGAYGLPEGIVTDQEAAIGLRAKENLYAGELLWQARLATEAEYQALCQREQAAKAEEAAEMARHPRMKLWKTIYVRIGIPIYLSHLLIQHIPPNA